MPKGVYAHQRKPIKERFMSKVDKDGPNGCWVWTGSIATNGYGAFRIETSSPVGAHRVSMMLFRGVPITPGRAMNVDHLCRNRRCVNPDHLEYVTSQENARRAVKAERAHRAVNAMSPDAAVQNVEVLTCASNLL